MTHPIALEQLDAAAFAAALPALAEVLHACVHAGASVSFVLPHSLADSRAFWQEKVWPGIAAGQRRLLVARADGRITGTVQLDDDSPPNQAHRVEIAKLLVHPDFRRRGIARALMIEVEKIAAEMGRRLITLDTRTGDTAEVLYRSLGYETAGVIPDFARAPDADRYDATTYMYKRL